MHTPTAALCLASAAAALMCGCAADPDVGTTPTVSKDVLRREITDRLTKAGNVPQSVTCNEDLVGDVGMTARCDVVLDPSNSFQPVVTVTKSDGSTIDYELTPAVSKEQLEGAVSRLAATPGAPVGSVSCESGLDGRIGATTRCEVESGGVKVQRTVAVNNVEGLMMNFDLVPL